MILEYVSAGELSIILGICFFIIMMVVIGIMFSKIEEWDIKKDEKLKRKK